MPSMHVAESRDSSDMEQNEVELFKENTNLGMLQQLHSKID